MSNGSILPEFIAVVILAGLTYALSSLFPDIDDNLRLAIAGAVAIVGWVIWHYAIGQRFKRFTDWLGVIWARLSNRAKAFVSTIKSFFRSTWGRRILAFWLLLLILEYVRSQLPLWPVTLLTFSLQLLLLLGLVFQISISRLGETHIKSYPQVFLSNPKCDKFRATASDSWKPAVVYAEPWRVTWREQARDLIACGAKWIWIRDQVTDDEAKNGCKVLHKRDFEVHEEFSSKSSHAEIVLCIDDEAIISVNQRQLEGIYKHWDQKIDLTPYLKPGINTLTMGLSNHAHLEDTPEQNPTGVIYKLTISY
jgi:hypothetical protein